MEQNTQNTDQKNEQPQVTNEPKPNTPHPEPKAENNYHNPPAGEKHYYCDCHHGRGFNFGRFLMGLIIVVVGLAFLAKTSGWVNFDFSLNWNYIWPILIIIAGLSLISFRGWAGAIFGGLITLIVIVIVLFLIFNIGFGGTLTGSGNIITQDRQVSDFNKISLSGYGNLIITQSTSTEALKIEAEDNLIPKIRTKVEDKTLKIDYEWQTWPWFSFKPKKPINFFVMVKDINQISVSGAGNIKGDSIKSEGLKIKISGAGKANISVETKNLDAEISGAGEFLMAGKTDSQKIELSGAAKYDGTNLESKTADIEISGAGQATIKVSEKLNAEISGAGRVDYIGNPQVTQQISGAGKINKLNE